MTIRLISSGLILGATRSGALRRLAASVSSWSQIANDFSPSIDVSSISAHLFAPCSTVLVGIRVTDPDKVLLGEMIITGRVFHISGSSASFGRRHQYSSPIRGARRISGVTRGGEVSATWTRFVGISVPTERVPPMRLWDAPPFIILISKSSLWLRHSKRRSDLLIPIRNGKFDEFCRC